MNSTQTNTKGWFFRSAAIILAGVALVAVATARGTPEDASAYGYLKLFNEVLALVRNSYVEDMPESDLMKGAYEGLLASLDGESEYIKGSEFEALKASRPGTEAETGMLLTRKEGLLFVAAVLPGSDAMTREIRLGDLVRRIGNQAGRDMTLAEAEQALRGPAGSKVSVSLSRREEPRREDVEIVRKKLSLPQPRLDPSRSGVAVVRIPTFAPGSARSLASILDRMQKEKVHTAVFDLRGNAWGDLTEAARAAALLTGQGVLANLRDRKGGEKPLQAQAGDTAWKGDLLLLTDAGTAYAAEAFVAALVDRGVAKQAGETTLGRGGEREYLPLGNGDYVALTVRKLVSPSGKTWHGAGLTPAVPIAQDPALPFKDRADQQLQKAIDSMKEAFAGAKAA